MLISNAENTKKRKIINIKVKDKLLDLSYPLVMGIINTTPDSFYSGSRKQNIKDILSSAEQMIEEGATILDIGGYSSRPGAKDVDLKEEIQRIKEPIYTIKKHFPDILISLDTFRSEVAKIGIENGADIINDISGFQVDPEIIDVVAHYQVPYILMHIKGTPQTMMNHTEYNNLFLDVVHYFSSKINQLKKKNVHDIIIDPGFGFSKTLDQNYLLFDHLKELKQIFDNFPLLVGISRKSMIYKKLNITPQEALPETLRLNKIALEKGADILRVHDVKEHIELFSH